MVTQRRRRVQRASATTQELERRVTQLLHRDPDLSRTAIVKELREEGLRFGNDRIRAIIRVARQDPRFGFGREAFPTARQFFTALREYGATISERIENAFEGTHVAMSWNGTCQYIVYLYGNVHARGVFTMRGRIVQPSERFQTDNVFARIEEQMVGRIIEETGLAGGGSHGAGIEVEVSGININIEQTEIR